MTTPGLDVGRKDEKFVFVAFDIFITVLNNNIEKFSIIVHSYFTVQITTRD